MTWKTFKFEESCGKCYNILENDKNKKKCQIKVIRIWKMMKKIVRIKKMAASH